MRFSFTGNVDLNGLESKNPFVREGKTRDGINYRSFNMSIVSEPNNRGYVECFGMVVDTIKTMDTDNNKIEISSSDQFDDDVIETVASYKKHVVDLFGERKQFITELAMIDYLCEHIDELKGKKVTVTGQAQVNEYNGKISRRFIIQNIYNASDEAKNQLKVTAETFFSKDDIDLEDWNDEKKLYLNGYTFDWIDGANHYISQQMILDASKINFDNEKHRKLLDFKLKMLGCTLDGNKVKNNIGKTIQSQMIICNYVNGAEKVEFDESMLTPIQKEKIELGLATVDDFRTGNIYGDRVTIFKINDFDLKNKYSDGIIDTEINISEFDEDIYTPVKVETEEDVLEGKTTKSVSDDEGEDDELGDLFD